MHSSQEFTSVYIAFEAFPRSKGASSHIASMISALATMPNEKILLLCLGISDMPSYQFEDNIHIRRYKEYHPNMLKRAEAFGDFIKDHLHNLSNVKRCVFRDIWSGIPALSANLDCSYIFEVNALSSWELVYTYPQFNENIALKSKIEDMEYVCLNKSTQILTVSSVTADALEKMGFDKNKITTIINSAHPAFFEKANNNLIIPILKTGRWIGYFGSLHSWQGVNIAICAFAKLAKDFPNLNFLIISGSKKNLKKPLMMLIKKLKMKDKIKIYSALSTDELATNIRCFEFTLAPLIDTERNVKQGCCPVKIIESMSAGIPVIASDIKCVRDLIEEENSILVQPNSTRELAIAMKNLLSDCTLRKKLASKSLKYAKENFQREKIHNNLQDIFNK